MAVANSINESTTGICGFTGTAFTGTPVTQYNVLVGSSTSSTLTNVAPSATSGVPLISQGSSSNPVFGTAVVAGGGTGNTSQTAYSLVAGGTTTTGAFQAVGPNSSSNAILMAAGTSTLPNFTTSGTPYVSGISFNSGTNTLQSYIYNTFTPGLTFGGGSTGMTFATQSGAYVKIGKLVYVTLQIVLSNKGSSTGSAVVTNLPFSAFNNHGILSFYPGDQVTYPASTTQLFAYISSGQTTIQIASVVSGGTAANLNQGNFSNTSNFSISGCYITSAD